MWFKNLKIYRFTQAFSVDTEKLPLMMHAMPFRHCGAQEISTMGFVSPFSGKHTKDDLLFHANNDAIWFTLKREDKILPASVINNELSEKVALIEQETGAPVPKKAQKEFKEEITNQLLPRAFAKQNYINGYISLTQQIVVVDASSDASAEIFLACLRKCLGSLPVVPFAKSQQQETLTNWLLKDAPEGFILQDEAELKSLADDGAMVRCKHQDLDADEVLAHIQAGKWVHKISVEYKERLTCIIAEDLSIKRLKFTELVTQQNEDIQNDEKEARLDADFILFTSEIDAFVKDLDSVFTLT